MLHRSIGMGDSTCLIRGCGIIPLRVFVKAMKVFLAVSFLKDNL